MKRTWVGALLVGALALNACASDGDGDGAAPQQSPPDAAAAKVGFDSGFGRDGFAAVPMSTTDPDRITAVTVGRDGKVYAAGHLTRAGDQHMAVTRLGADGKPDATFGTAGVATVNASVGTTGEVARGVALQSDGKVVITGSAEHDATAAGDAAKDTDIVAARFDTSGKLDPTFGTGGIARFDLGTGRATSATAFTGDTSWGLAVLPGDKLAVFGTRLADGADRTDADYVLIGLTAAGALDPAFGTAGVTTVDLDNSGDTARTVGVHGNKLLATGYSRDGDGIVSPVLIRTSFDGKLDTAFGTGGVANHELLPGVAESYQFGVQGDSYVLAGYGRGADSTEKVDLIAYRFTANGQWDKTFGTGGLTRVDVAKDDDRGRDLAVLPDGRILVVGSGKETAAKVGPMAVLLSKDGAPVANFGNGGRVISDFGGPADSWYGVALSPDKKSAYLVGYKGTNATSGGNDDAVVGRITL